MNKIEDRKELEAIFDTIYSSYVNKVEYFAYNYLYDKKAAECVTQEVFISLWENFENIDFEKNVFAYLISITKHKCLNILRKQKNERIYADSVISHTRESLNFASLKESACDRLYESEIESLLKKAMDLMPPKTKDVFFLSRYKNLKYSEIAILQGVSAKNIEYRMTSALRILREVFRDYLLLFVFIYIIRH